MINIKKFIEENHLERTVYLSGQKDNPYKYMKQSDLFVCSSRWEGFSTVISEAVILGIPILTTNVSGTKELLGENEFGVVVENKTDDLYRGLKEYLLDSKLQRYYKDKIKDRIHFFDEKMQVKEIEGLFK